MMEEEDSVSVGLCIGVLFVILYWLILGVYVSF